MLNKGLKDEAVKIHQKAISKYNSTYELFQHDMIKLHEKQEKGIYLLCDVEKLINSIANTPKEFQKKIADIQVNRKSFKDTEVYAKEAMDAAVKSGKSLAAGVTSGVAFASMAPTAAMWVATTFGTASTGTAISALHGAVATKAALAWLGGGALSAGGGGIAAGKALLALAGPIGWGIAGTATAASAFALGHKNKKIAEAAIADAEVITSAGADLKETVAKVEYRTEQTILLLDKLHDMNEASQHLRDADYLELSEEDQYRLGTLVNNALSFAELLTKDLD